MYATQSISVSAGSSRCRHLATRVTFVRVEARRLTGHFGQNQNTRQHLPTHQHCSSVASGPDIMGIIKAGPDPLKADHLAETLRQVQTLFVRGHQLYACLH